jgi:tRNA/tmRNA/rRNA uracil-C5-methylase (TrmA/RlmC/RlmD family)
VLDPPRAGVSRAVIERLVGPEGSDNSKKQGDGPAGPRRIAYVSCDPATLARDIAVFRRLGWQLAALRAFDMFPMTHHVECLAVLSPQAVPA